MIGQEAMLSCTMTGLGAISVGHNYQYSSTIPEYYSPNIRIGRFPWVLEYSNITRLLLDYHVTISRVAAKAL
jgi:hypothetical protein